MAESLRSSKDNDKHRKRPKAKEKSDSTEVRVVEEGWAEPIPECAVCLQTCVHPAKLPCSHIFCFLCLKGLATQSRRCAMCRQDIPLDYLDHPQLLEVPTHAEKEAFEDGYQWFYEGRSGWWQYDERTSRELEAAYKSGLRICELLIVGQLYIADFDAMLQLRRNDMSRRRRIKRDLASIPKKGIAGLRLNGESDNAVPSTSQQQPPIRTDSDVNQFPRAIPEVYGFPTSQNSWQSNHVEVTDLPRPDELRNLENTVDSDEDPGPEEDEQKHHTGNEADNAESSDSDQTDLETQFRDLLLH